jgi:16S rRNA (guanine966-N2)-methyltransferase
LKNLNKTHLSSNSEVLCVDAMRFLKSQPLIGCDYIYIAPPQYKKLWLKTLQLLDEHHLHVSTDGWVIVQIDPTEEENIMLNHFELFDKRKYGNTLLLFYFCK